MLKLMKKRLKNQKGLTLVEVLAVVVILAIVAMIAIPAIGNIIENNRIKAVKADAVNIISAANIYYTDGNTDTFSDALPKTVLRQYIQNPGSIKEYSVTRDGKLRGEGVKGNVRIVFSGATVKEVDAETTKPNGKVTIHKDYNPSTTTTDPSDN